jgi:hypothetical protein
VDDGFVNKHGLGSGEHVDAPALEGYFAGSGGKNGVVLAQSAVQPRKEFGAGLPHNNVSGLDALAPKDFNSQPLGV